MAQYFSTVLTSLIILVLQTHEFGIGIGMSLSLSSPFTITHERTYDKSIDVNSIRAHAGHHWHKKKGKR